METVVDRTIRDDGGIGARLASIDQADTLELEALLDLAFGTDRRQRTAYRLREGVAFDEAASCAAFDARMVLVGSLQTWPLALTASDQSITALWLIGPIAVHPDRQNAGIGRAMLRRALEAIDKTSIPAVLIGDAPYYGPFGFDASATQGWSLPGPFDRHRLLARVRDGVSLPAIGRLGPRR